ncbi:MAG: FAD-dependent oxidoreductase [Eubacterium sp.]|nr:FAD-dependent oxidoreductase [Eubacterium sp.]
MLKYNQCKIDYRRDSIEELRKKIAEILRIQETEIDQVKILKKSIDARKKPQIYYNYSVAFECTQEQKVLQKNRKDKNLSVYVSQPSLEDMVPRLKKETGERVVIVGTGPAGLFCGYYLALCGRKPLLIERGASMWERVGKVSAFWKDGVLDPDTNVSFGEGGAGTFSDGKLNTGVKDKTGKKKFILDTFIRHGAPDEIGYLSKPHIGTDELRGVIQSMGETIRQLGGTYRFHTRLTGFQYEEEEYGPGQKQLRAVVVENERGEREEIPCDKCVLAIGHSARDTFSMLREDGAAMEQKPFAVGVRVEHPQKSINKMQYGVEDPRLPAADYKLTGKTSDGRGVYSFCMCPGGYVVNASTEPGGTVINGMSDHARDSAHANSAIVVTVDQKDFGSDDVLAGVAFQRRLEEKTWQTGGGMIPVQRYGDFVKGVPTTELNHSLPVTKGKFVPADVKKILPSYISNGIMEGMKQFGQKITDFDAEETLVLGTETRTSSPVRILRNHEFESENRRGIYPCGEGAGYAGGIMSAAMDGLRVALQIVSERNNQRL